MKDKEQKVEEFKVPHTLGNTVWTPPKTPVRCGVMCPTGRTGSETGTGTVPRGVDAHVNLIFSLLREFITKFSI